MKSESNVFRAVTFSEPPASIQARYWLCGQINDHVEGVATDGFEEVADLFRKNFMYKHERDGAALAIYYKGKLVVDLWGGWADRINEREWTQNTMANIFCCTKSVAAICVAMKVHAGECFYSDKVTRFWPEFGKNGKENITIDMILNHRAGIPYLEEDLTLDEAADKTKISKVLEEESPKHPPDSQIAYHPITFGWLIDQVFCRIDAKHRSIGEYFRDEIRQKYGIDIYIGSCTDQEGRIAKVSPLRKTSAFREYVDDRKIFSMGNLLHGKDAAALQRMRLQPLSENIELFNTPAMRSFEQPALNGVATARGLALLHQKFMDGTLCSQQFFKNLAQPQYEETFDHTLGIEESKGHGFVYKRSPNGSWLIGHPAMGGQMIWMDPFKDIVVCYLTNGLKLPSLNQLNFADTIQKEEDVNSNLKD
ncbi:unnamed protein product [Cylicocyclus nassatus]|uniref:Beta-lactamase-related domain-containing protein n=1 Tax=Cylicocyclus nassatus TaxID=53992 RepID=A0AA36MDF0_CYLNA|nr:unnamed protein product [Cylicocyclus nassatus]